jgi:hypothetical protein
MGRVSVGRQCRSVVTAAGVEKKAAPCHHQDKGAASK